MTLVSNWADFSNAMKPAYLLTINGNQWLTIMNQSILDLMGNTGFIFHSDPYTSIEFNYHNETTNVSQLHVKGWAKHGSFILSFSSAPWGQGLIFVHHLCPQPALLPHAGQPNGPISRYCYNLSPQLYRGANSGSVVTTCPRTSGRAAWPGACILDMSKYVTRHLDPNN